ncbi:hypothetical protein EDF79_3743 [Raoultella terrigena]|nr:hypothetical protein EDF79_3743 [Raoultella terrigena]
MSDTTHKWHTVALLAGILCIAAKLRVPYE